MFRLRSIWLALFVLIATSLACALGGTNPQPASQPAATNTQPASIPTPTLAPQATFTPGASAQPASPSTELPAESPTPTETSLPPTETATATPTPRVLLPAKTLRPIGTIAPLTVNYEVVEIKRGPGNQATLVLKVIATGGGGGYHYYHDDIAQSGAIFNVIGTCGKPFVHTIKVTSAGKQTVSLSYFVKGNCPTPTPTPKP